MAIRNNVKKFYESFIDGKHKDKLFRLVPAPAIGDNCFWAEESPEGEFFEELCKKGFYLQAYLASPHIRVWVGNPVLVKFKTLKQEYEFAFATKKA